jgi:hypothetical protein
VLGSLGDHIIDENAGRGKEMRAPVLTLQI